MKNAVAVEVNKIEWQKPNTVVTEAKMSQEIQTGESIYYYRYLLISGLQLTSTNVLRRWFVDFKRTAIPKKKWATLPIVKGNLPE